MAGVRRWRKKKLRKVKMDGRNEMKETKKRSEVRRKNVKWNGRSEEKKSGRGRRMKGDEKVKDVERNEKVEWDGWKGRGGAMGDGERDGRYEKMWDGVKWSECKKLGNGKELKEMKRLKWMDRRGEGVTNEMGNEMKMKRKGKWN